MAKTLTPGGDQDGAMQGLMNDIVKGVKIKLVEPVIDESRKLGKLLEEQYGSDRKEFEEIKVRLAHLEEAVKTTPVLLLAAIKEAINQAGMDGKS
ncbi:MAG: hypothetical protein ACOY4I_17525 [Bacillota bacterium]